MYVVQVGLVYKCIITHMYYVGVALSHWIDIGCNNYQVLKTRQTQSSLVFLRKKWIRNEKADLQTQKKIHIHWLT
jgi:hypothetical protein